MHTEQVKNFLERRKRLGLGGGPMPVPSAKKLEAIIIPIRDELREASPSQQKQLRGRLNEIREDIIALYQRAKSLEKDLPEEVFTGVAPRKIPARVIIAAVAKYYGFTLTELYSVRRPEKLARAKHVAMFLVQKMTSLSLPAIGNRMGGRDHTTILHGVQKIKKKLLTDEALAKEIAELTELLSDKGSESV